MVSVLTSFSTPGFTHRTHAYRVAARSRRPRKRTIEIHLVTECTGKRTKSGAAPDPFHAGHESAEIPFTLSQRTRATLRVFDATGRQVRLLIDSVLEAGEHMEGWDG